MTLTLAVVGAVAAALLQSTVMPFLEIGGARPDLVLLYAVIVTIVIGIDHGIAAAFFGGLAIDVLAPRPLGSTAFVLLVIVGGAAVIGRVLLHARAVSTVIAAFLLGVAGPILFLVVYGALRGPIPVADPVLPVLPGAVYGAAVAAVVGPAATILHRRYFERDRIDW